MSVRGKWSVLQKSHIWRRLVSFLAHFNRNVRSSAIAAEEESATTNAREDKDENDLHIVQDQ